MAGCTGWLAVPGNAVLFCLVYKSEVNGNTSLNKCKSNGHEYSIDLDKLMRNWYLVWKLIVLFSNSDIYHANSTIKIFSKVSPQNSFLSSSECHMHPFDKYRIPKKTNLSMNELWYQLCLSLTNYIVYLWNKESYILYTTNHYLLTQIVYYILFISDI